MMLKFYQSDSQFIGDIENNRQYALYWSLSDMVLVSAISGFTFTIEEWNSLHLPEDKQVHCHLKPQNILFDSMSRRYYSMQFLCLILLMDDPCLQILIMKQAPYVATIFFSHIVKPN